MSTKSSPTKNDKITSSPSKKDEKASSSLILTRNQSSFLNTRQLRNKASSRKKISEFTQQLMSPMKERGIKGQSQKKKSPKYKKEKMKPVVIKETVNFSELILESKKEIKQYPNKRKIVAAAEGVLPAKRCRSPLGLTAAELVSLCSEQSLDDEDFLEILTCESPVWWEDPPAYSTQDEIITQSDEIRYFQDLIQSVKVEPITDINIPTVKQKDDKFMKKRNKLEGLLGNIKNKLTVDKTDIPKHIDIKTESPNANDASDDGKYIKEERQYQRKKSHSESTSSSEEMFFGFQNEDVLKDFENMDIPIEGKQKVKIENIDTKPKDIIDAKNENTTASSFLGSTDDYVEKKDGLCDLQCNTQNSVTSNNKNLGNQGVSQTNNSRHARNSNLDSVKIYYIDNVSSKSRKKTTKNKKNINITKEINSNKVTVKASSLLIKEEPQEHADIEKHIIDYTIQRISAETNDKIISNSTDGNSVESVNDTVKEEKKKSNKSKNLYKDQLMTVYKIITDEKYREQFKKTDKTSKVDKMNPNANGLDSLLKDCSRKSDANRSVLLSNQETDEKEDASKTPIVDLVIKNETECEKKIDVKEKAITKVIVDVVEDKKELHEDDDKNQKFTANLTNKRNKDKIMKYNTYVLIPETKNKIKKGDHKEKCITDASKTNLETKPIQNNEPINSTTANDYNENIKDISGNRDTSTEGSLNITSDVKSAKYCLKCSSIFETDTCSYCVKKMQVNKDKIKNGSQPPRK